MNESDVYLKNQTLKQQNSLCPPPFIRMSTLLSKDSADAKKARRQLQKDQPYIMDAAEDEKSRSESFHSQTKDNKTDGNNNTLGSLTKKFVQLIKAAPSQVIEIQQASQRLDIQKRRIYDITNVLEGIGYIQKLGKNLMKWVGGQQGTELQMQVKKLQQKSDKLSEDMYKVEQQIAELKNDLINLSNQNTYLNYFLKEDIVLIMRALNVKSILLFIGGNGDQLEILSNPEKKTSQWTIQSGSTLSKLFHCRLNEEMSHIQIIQNPQFDNMVAQKTIKPKPKSITEDKPFKAALQDAYMQSKTFYEHSFLEYDLMLSIASQQQENQNYQSEDEVLNLQGQ